MRTKEMKYKKAKKSRLMWQWVLSYTSVLLIPILICSFYYFHSYNMLKERTLSNQNLILEKSKDQLDFAFYDAINLSNHLQLNHYINDLALGKSSLGSTPALDRHYLRNDLKMKNQCFPIWMDPEYQTRTGIE